MIPPEKEKKTYEVVIQIMTLFKDIILGPSPPDKLSLAMVPFGYGAVPISSNDLLAVQKNGIGCLRSIF